MKLSFAIACLGCLLVAEARAATYTVPPGRFLAEPLTIPLSDAKLWQDSELVYLLYSLPKELDGPQPQNILVSGKANGSEFVLKNEDTFADCVVQDETTTCTVRYDDLHLNHEGADAFLAAHIPEPERRLQLRNAREELEHQAVGIVTFRPNRVINQRGLQRCSQSRAHLPPQ